MDNDVAASSPPSTADISPTSPSPVTLPPCNTQQVVETLGRGQRPRVPSVKLKDYVTYNAIHLEDPSSSLSHACSTSSSETFQGNSLYTLTDYVSDKNFSVSHQVFLAAVMAYTEPRYYSQATKDDIWCGAMKHEVLAHEDSGTWEITSLPAGKTAIGSQWVYKYKFNADGTMECPKARLVANGNNQVASEVSLIFRRHLPML